MSDTITITLSRADAELLADLADTGLDHETSYPSMDGFTPQFRAELDRLREDGQRVIKSIYAALDAALAPEPGDALAAALPAIIRALRAENPESWTLVEMVEAGAFPLTDAERAAVLALAAPAEGLSFLQKMQKTQAAPAEGPERAATGELEALIAECETRFLEWRLDGTWVEDGPGSAHWESAAAVRAHGWEDAPPDDADEDGWIGICDDRTDADLAGLLRSALRASGDERGA